MALPAALVPFGDVAVTSPMPGAVLACLVACLPTRVRLHEVALGNHPGQEQVGLQQAHCGLGPTKAALGNSVHD